MMQTDGPRIPLVDIGPWYAGGAVERSRIAGAVDEALKDFGFLMIVGHRLPAKMIDDVRQAALEFFRLSTEVKAEYAVGPGGHGWMPPGVEANAASDGLAGPPDLKESFGFGRSDVDVTGMSASESKWYGQNSWPAEPASFQAVVCRYPEAAAELADDLLQIFASALDLPVDFFTARCARSPWQTNLNWYPARAAISSVAPDQFRVGQHTDFGTLTILDRQHGSGGLQVRTLDGDWIDAPFVPGSLTINTGDLLARWSGDRWRSTLHRVLPPPADLVTEELVSLVFFHEADPATVIETIPSKLAGPTVYEPVTAGEFLDARIRSITVAAG